MNLEIACQLVQRGAKDTDGWEHDLWRVSLEYRGRAISTEYRTGIGHRALPRHLERVYAGVTGPKSMDYHLREAAKVCVAPDVKSVLSALFLDADCANDTFESFCSEMGLSTDSRKALAAYLDCQATEIKLRRLFGQDYNEAREWSNDE